MWRLWYYIGWVSAQWSRYQHATERLELILVRDKPGLFGTQGTYMVAAREEPGSMILRVCGTGTRNQWCLVSQVY